MDRRIPGTARRDGVALVAALAILALSSALLAGAFAAARAMTRAARSARALARAEAGAQRALGDVLLGWNEALDGLPVGAYLEPAGPVESADTAEVMPRLVSRRRVTRLTERLYVVSVDVRVLDGELPVAWRRARLVLERPVRADSTVPPTRPVPISRWSFAELY